MSILTSYASESARDTAAPAASNTGLCIFRSDTNAIEVSDGTSYQTYNSDGVIAHTFSSNTKALDFDGSNDYVSIADDNTLDLTDNFSITAWVNFDSLSGAPMIFSKRASLSGHAYQFYSTSNKLAFNNGGGINYSTATLSINTWYHVGVTFASGVVTFYLNGNPSGGFTSTNGSNPTNTYELQIGRAFNGNYFNGKMDEVAIFNSVLTEPQILSIYNNKAYPPILSIWRFEDDVTDSVGSNDGTNNGATFVAKADDPANTPY